MVDFLMHDTHRKRVLLTKSAAPAVRNVCRNVNDTPLTKHQRCERCIEIFKRKYEKCPDYSKYYDILLRLRQTCNDNNVSIPLRHLQKQSIIDDISQLRSKLCILRCSLFSVQC